MGSNVRQRTTGDLVPPYDAAPETLEALSHPRRVRTIAILRRHDCALTASDLATHVVARENDEPLVAVTESEYETALISLRHSHLPALSARDLVEWDRGTGTVDLGDTVPAPQSKLHALLESDVDDVEAVLATLANDRRRAALSVLDALEGATSVTKLAERVAAREDDTDPGSVSATERRRIEISLYHAHLPAMEGAGLLEYDPDDGEVALDDHPLLVP